MRHVNPKSGPAAGRRIAVVGSGVAGLSAAWLLSKRHDVTLYEKDSWIGGHANTVDVPCPEGVIPVDTGFIVYNEDNYPNFSALLAHLNVPSHATDMSLGVSIGGGRIEYSSRPHGLFGQKRNLVAPRFWGMLREILRFYAATRDLPHNSVDDISLGDFLDRGKYSAALIDEHVLPMCAAIWSTTARDIRRYPMRSFLQFFSNHGLLQVLNRPQWRTLIGGSRSYVQALRKEMGNRIRVRGAAQSIWLGGEQCIVTDCTGAQEVFEDVVLATHADQALALIDNPTSEEQRWLGAFRYTPNVAVLHDDRALMPKRRAVWASWNYIAAHDVSPDQPLCVSYWMNYLQSLPTRRQLFVTLNPSIPPKAGSVVQSFEYTHPLFDAAALAAQDNLWRIQGQRKLWFCGSYFGYGFHEDALQSGLAVAAAFGEVPPWTPKLSRIAGMPLQHSSGVDVLDGKSLEPAQ